MLNTQKVMDNILGNKKRKVRQNKVNLDDIKSLDELKLFLLEQDAGHPTTIEPDVIMIFGDGEIVCTKSGSLYGQRGFHAFREQITGKEFIKLKHGKKGQTYVTLSDKYNWRDIFNLIKRVYAQALLTGEVRKYR